MERYADWKVEPIPARAGMNRLGSRASAMSGADPRTSGDEPVKCILLARKLIRSPHERG